MYYCFNFQTNLLKKIENSVSFGKASLAVSVTVCFSLKNRYQLIFNDNISYVFKDTMNYFFQFNNLLTNTFKFLSLVR